MTDPAPIVVNQSPVPDQQAVALRQALLALGGAASAFGAIGLSTDLNRLADDAGLLMLGIGGAVTVGTFIWGQIKTRLSAQQKATMANALPDSIAVTK